FNALSHDIGKNVSVTRRPSSNGSENIRLSSAEHDRDVWAFMNVPVSVGDRMVKLSDYAVIEQRQTPPAIAKKNQEYTLCLQYEYIGSNNQGTKLQNRVLEKFSATLPMGYKAEEETRSWNFGKDPTQYALLALIAAIIFFISAILFNSLRQPFAIIAVIPVSFIGVFLTFYIFDLRFDQGGFASFILLCGITVNAAIYIINEYNSLRAAHPHVKQENLYRRAFRAKITAVLLTVLSTVLGFIPFVIGSTREGFWFPLAAGTMGGLLMSMLAIFILLPLCIIPTVKNPHRDCHAS
ncbi:MAG: efflux RND transporter permease subunit, partial [Muribaculaceae bacterium]|nr:efflux RND transporter permease subunit [Muribaculaceae bacterium]